MKSLVMDDLMKKRRFGFYVKCFFILYFFNKFFNVVAQSSCWGK